MNDYSSNKKPKKLTPLQAKLKAESYCAYQERYQQEVRNKLYEWGLHNNDVENIIADLITSGFLNEERFAKAFARGKFRIKKWGRIKIKLELKARKISDYCIKQAIKEINEEDYISTLEEIVTKKYKTIKATKAEVKKFKTAQYAISRGFESDLVWEILKEDKSF